MRKGILFIIFLFVASIAPAQAATLTFDYNFTFSGTNPAGPTPWLTATFDDHGGSGSVTLTMTASNLVGTEFVSEWSFNLDPQLNPVNLTFAYVSGVTADSAATGANAFKADGDGFFDILFSYPTAANQDRFGPGESSVYDISGIASLTANSFNFFSVSIPPPAVGTGVFLAAAHIQGIGTANDSGWIAPGPQEVPEPGTLILLGLGIIGIGVGVRFRR